MGHLTYDQSVKTAYKIITVLGVITICEVLFALLGKGYLVESIHFNETLIAFVMIVMSIVKAYLIVYEFMHMKYEVPGMVKSVLLPLGLLVWAIIAFIMEGNYWRNSRAGIGDRNMEKIELKSEPKLPSKPAPAMKTIEHSGH
jgi:cytochrome c oxidase subunit IV